MEYEIGKMLEQLHTDHEELKEIGYVALKVLEKISPGKYKEVVEEIKKQQQKK